jgi:hypothetical protein
VKVSPARAGIWIADGRSPAGVTLIAVTLGWDGDSGGGPSPEPHELAVREVTGQHLTDDEMGALAFRHNPAAGKWLNENAAPAGYRFGWHGGTFLLATGKKWAALGGPRRAVRAFPR